MPYIEELRTLVGHRPLILVGVPVMIFDDYHRLLLQFRADDNAWGLPGGYIEPGETAEETARREVREETGLDVGKLTLFKVFSGKEFFYECPNGDQVFAVWVVYVTNDVRGDLQPDGKEGFELRYFSLQDIPVELTPQVKLIVESFLKANRL
jgi:8-oxo-dGTP pyrophosphatase MutT (NUDIX family)